MRSELVTQLQKRGYAWPTTHKELINKYNFVDFYNYVRHIFK